MFRKYQVLHLATPHSISASYSCNKDRKIFLILTHFANVSLSLPQNQLILYMIRIFLTGYMGAGKTTLGKAFAKAKGIDFIDLDWYIEKRFHKTIKELFAERGEDGFRTIEKNMLHEVGEFENVLISTGGGTPCFFDNMEYMNQQGETVFLDVPIDVLFRRLKIAKHQRPILKDKNDEELRLFIEEALQKRLSFYQQAHHSFDGSFLESRSQINESIEKLEALLSANSKK